MSVLADAKVRALSVRVAFSTVSEAEHVPGSRRKVRHTPMPHAQITKYCSTFRHDHLRRRHRSPSWFDHVYVDWFPSCACENVSPRPSKNSGTMASVNVSIMLHG